ncbi:MAG: transposase, partial [Clostridiales bacterium]|nr:transposase [Clostridiales bacterium]
MNRLKLERGVDMYIPLRDKMVAYKLAISVANSELNWQKHPDKSRHGEMIALVNLPADCWVQKKSKVPNVPLNACVVWNVPKDEYFVIVTTDITKAAREIIKIYALRVE